MFHKNQNNLFHGLQSKQKGAILTALMWISGHKTRDNVIIDHNQLQTTAALINYSLNDPSLTAFDELDERSLGEILSTLNERQRIWLVAEMHVMATKDGVMEVNPIHVAMMIAENMGISKEQYVRVFEAATSLNPPDIKPLEPMVSPKYILPLNSGDENEWDAFADGFSLTHVIRSFKRWFEEDDIDFMTYISNFKELTGDHLLTRDDYRPSRFINVLKLVNTDEFDPFFTAAYPDVVYWYYYEKNNNCKKRIASLSEKFVDSEGSLKNMGYFFVKHEYFKDGVFKGFECSSMIQNPSKSRLIDQLKRKAAAFVKIQNTLKEKIAAQDSNAIELIKIYEYATTSMYREIGIRLKAIGGDKLMQSAIREVIDVSCAHNMIRGAWSTL